MKIQVQVKLRASIEKVEMISEHNYIVYIHAAPVKGQANEAIVEILSRYFHVPKSTILIVTGHSSRTKWIEIPVI
ncbi:DUF167 domain-containing protein [Candidatus Roizmanbacteria bacterium]|nr:DUF167 domain-containing protein [Candidatus Roizmanbacteria bacterium]